GAALGVWVALPFLVFSTSGSKLPAYLLPCFPALALLAARALSTNGMAAGGSALSAFLLAGALEIGGPAALAALPASDRPPASLPALAHAAALAWLGAST